MAKVALLCLSIVAAFFAGRMVPRASSRVDTGVIGDKDAAAQPAWSVGRRSAFPLRDPSVPSPSTTITVANGRRVIPAYAEALRTDRDGAERSHNAVLRVLETRRRSNDVGLRACLAGADVHGPISIAFDVEVTVSATEMHVGNPTAVEVTEGPPLEDSTLRCLDGLLAGDDKVAAASTAPFLTSYAGSIDYSASFLMD